MNETVLTRFSDLSFYIKTAYIKILVMYRTFSNINITRLIVIRISRSTFQFVTLTDIYPHVLISSTMI